MSMSFHPNSNICKSQIIERVIFPFNIYKRDIEIDEYFEKLYLEPECKIYQGIGNTTNPRVSKAILSEINQYNGITIIIGMMGSGKSALLLKLFLNRLKINSYYNQNSPSIIYNFSDILDDDKILYNILSDKWSSPYVYIDSLDETSVEYESKRVERCLQKISLLRNAIICCRTPFFYDQFLPNFKNNIKLIIELLPLSKKAQVSTVSNYLRFLCNIDLEYERKIRHATDIISRCRGHVSTEKALVATPLFSALATIVSLSINKNNIHRLHGITHVYNLFIHEIVKRIFFNKIKISDLSNIAHDLYEKKINNEPFYLNNINNIHITKNIDCICLTRHSLIDENILLNDFRHRSVFEFLIAYHIVNNLLAKESDIENKLNKLYNYETSYFIRGLLNDLTWKDKQNVVSTLQRYAIDNLKTSGDKEAIACHNAIYFSSIISVNSEEFIRKLHSIARTSDSIINPLIIGTILSRIVDLSLYDGAASDFVAEIEEGTAIGLRTLNYYLFYYGDSDISRLSDLTKPIYPNQPWEATRNTIIDRINTLDEKRLKFRAIDLAALRQLCSYTKYEFNQIENKILSEIFINCHDWIDLAKQVDRPILITQVLKFLNEFPLLTNEQIEKLGLSESQITTFSEVDYMTSNKESNNSRSTTMIFQAPVDTVISDSTGVVNINKVTNVHYQQVLDKLDQIKPKKTEDFGIIKEIKDQLVKLIAGQITHLPSFAINWLKENTSLFGDALTPIIKIITGG